jgi:hypothetical protein
MRHFLSVGFQASEEQCRHVLGGAVEQTCANAGDGAADEDMSLPNPAGLLVERCMEADSSTALLGGVRRPFLAMRSSSCISGGVTSSVNVA